MRRQPAWIIEAGGPGRFSDSIMVENTTTTIGYGGEARPAVRVYRIIPRGREWNVSTG